MTALDQALIKACHHPKSRPAVAKQPPRPHRAWQGDPPCRFPRHWPI